MHCVRHFCSRAHASLPLALRRLRSGSMNAVIAHQEPASRNAAIASARAAERGGGNVGTDTSRYARAGVQVPTG